MFFYFLIEILNIPGKEAKTKVEKYQANDEIKDDYHYSEFLSKFCRGIPRSFAKKVC